MQQVAELVLDWMRWRPTPKLRAFSCNEIPPRASGPLERAKGGAQQMRFLMKVSLPVEKANAAAKDGSLARTIQSIVAELKPEAAYFATDGQGRRAGYLFFDMEEPSQIPAVAEPWFLALNAAVEIVPAMKPEDLVKAEPHIKKAAKKYG